MKKAVLILLLALSFRAFAAADPPSPEATARQGFPKPYSPPCVERENVFEFTSKPAVRKIGDDKYEITFAAKANCDATVAIVDADGRVVRHLAAGVLGSNAPAPFRKGSLSQVLEWNGKDDLSEYVKEPSKLRVQVRLGLMPVFDKLLGVHDPKNVPGMILGVAADEDGVYVWIRGQGTMGHVTIRKFDHDVGYVSTLVPPPPSLPESKLGGRSYVDWEPGKRSHHGPYMQADIGYDGQALPGVGGRGVVDFQPAIIGRKMFFCNAGPGYRAGDDISKCYYIYTDGSSDVSGFRARPFAPGGMGHEFPRFAGSPDGKWLYATGVGTGSKGSAPVVLRMAVAGESPAELFVGRAQFKGKKPDLSPGSDNSSLNNPTGIDTDSAGRIYICDNYNNRLQVFSPDGEYVATIPVDRPRLVCVHKKTGAIYVQHMGEVRGRSVPRMSKFTSLARPTVEASADGIETAVMALDSWTAVPRLWIGGGMNRLSVTTADSYVDRGPSITVWEESGKSFREIADFDRELREKRGDEYMGRWEGGCYDKVVCDPVREQLWWCWEKNQPSRVVFDLRSGRILGEAWLFGATDDVAFDKRGYLHSHFNPGFFMPGVGRFDPENRAAYEGKGSRWRVPRNKVFTMKEAPYDFGIPSEQPGSRNWMGILPVKDQPGAKFFQDGMGVNMRGDIAEQCNIYYVPKMEAEGWAQADSGRAMRERLGQGGGASRYPEFLMYIKGLEQKGELIYSIRREPGLPATGGTIWTFDRSGELRHESAAITHQCLAGTQMDEDGNLYFGTSNGRMFDGQVFLRNRGGNLGTDTPLDRANGTPVTYTYVKAHSDKVRWLFPKSSVPLEPLPSRPFDLTSWGPFGAPEGGLWADGVEWLYAGYSPGVPSGCTCPSSRPHLDWFKRSYLPEAYRFSIGILDTNGNLIMHLGRYGNMDDALAMKPGSTDIAVTLPRFISGTDNYLAFDDWGERLVVLKLAYHAEETAAVQQ